MKRDRHTTTLRERRDNFATGCQVFWKAEASLKWTEIARRRRVARDRDARRRARRFPIVDIIRPR